MKLSVLAGCLIFIMLPCLANAADNYCQGNNCPTPEGISALNQLCTDFKNDAGKTFNNQFTEQQWIQLENGISNIANTMQSSMNEAPACNFSTK